jgi:hypothetical protein
MEVGFTTEATIAKSYMRFQGGLGRIAIAEREPERAYCLHCRTRLPAKPADLMRTA